MLVACRLRAQQHWHHQSPASCPALQPVEKQARELELDLKETSIATFQALLLASKAALGKFRLRNSSLPIGTCQSVRLKIRIDTHTEMGAVYCWFPFRLARETLQYFGLCQPDKRNCEVASDRTKGKVQATCHAQKLQGPCPKAAHDLEMLLLPPRCQLDTHSRSMCKPSCSGSDLQLINNSSPDGHETPAQLQ